MLLLGEIYKIKDAIPTIGIPNFLHNIVSHHHNICVAPPGPSRLSFLPQPRMCIIGMKLATFPRLTCESRMMLLSLIWGQGSPSLVAGRHITKLATMFLPMSTFIALVSYLVPLLIYTFMAFNRLGKIDEEMWFQSLKVNYFAPPMCLYYGLTTYCLHHLCKE